METKKQTKPEAKKSFSLPKVEASSSSASTLIPKMLDGGLTTEQAMEFLGKSSDKATRVVLREALKIGVKQGLTPILLRMGSTKVYSLVKPEDAGDFKAYALKQGFVVEEKLPKSIRIALNQKQSEA